MRSFRNNHFGIVLLVWVLFSIQVTAYGPFITDDFLLIARLRCAFAVLKSGFALEKIDQYPVYFRHDSVVLLAQAGVYHGATNIEEYIKFAFAEYSPYRTVEDPNKSQNFFSRLRYING
jgi:hypothetical protein